VHATAIPPGLVDAVARPRRRGHRLALASVIAVFVMAILAGCGGGGTTGSRATPSSKTSGPSSQIQSQLLRFAGCMRSHGVPKFPNPPTTGSGGLQVQIAEKHLDIHSRQFRTAQAACRPLLPAAVKSGA